ncbi:hypothetical protein [Brevibacillus nitrificans]|nr:hypothetical protein [Brevibacillus nitrificans]MDR7314575.1 hypothetical protein [Brevibacillus nitrificans]
MRYPAKWRSSNRRTFSLTAVPITLGEIIKIAGLATQSCPKD